MRAKILTNNDSARKNYAEKTGLDESMYIDNNPMLAQTVQLPTNLFSMDDDGMLYDDDEDFDMMINRDHYVGNLSDLYRNL
jgi:hypothetical protein